MSQNETLETDGLSPQQRLAVEALIAGHTMTEAADAARVTRQTVPPWRSETPAFQAAYNRTQNELAAAMKAHGSRNWQNGLWRPSRARWSKVMSAPRLRSSRD